MNDTDYRARFPVASHTQRQPSASLRIPRRPPPESDNLQAAIPPLRRSGRLRVGLACLAAAAGLGVLLLIARGGFGGILGGSAGNGLGQILGGGLLQGGLPPTRDPADAVETTADGDAGGTVTGESSDPPETVSGIAPGETPPGEPFEETPNLQETELPGEPTTKPVEPGTSAVEPPATEAATEAAATDPAEGDTMAETESATAPEPETEGMEGAHPAPSAPAGCYPFVSKDMSQAAYGVGYVMGEGVELPSHLPEGRLWGVEGSPAVLVINTHPYEGYSDGGSWYDPSEGSLAQVSSPNASDGAVALGAELTRRLREQGITVIQLRIAVSPEDSAADIYERTETVARYYCRLYPDIGLILNLRRSAELTEEGGILRTEGELAGEACAQTRISVSGGRGEDAFGRDLSAALALRAALWEREVTLSRPVWVKTGKGFAADLDRVRILTLEMGSAGNTFAEAARLLQPLAEALTDLLECD